MVVACPYKTLSSVGTVCETAGSSEWLRFGVVQVLRAYRVMPSVLPIHGQFGQLDISVILEFCLFMPCELFDLLVVHYSMAVFCFAFPFGCAFGGQLACVAFCCTHTTFLFLHFPSFAERRRRLLLRSGLWRTGLPAYARACGRGRQAEQAIQPALLPCCGLTTIHDMHSTFTCLLPFYYLPQPYALPFARLVFIVSVICNILL